MATQQISGIRKPIYCAARLALFLALINLVAHTPAGAAPLSLDSRVVTVWQTRDGLPQQTVKSILQSTDGYLWIATDDGLGRFDGSLFTEYDTADTHGLAVDDVDGILEDADGYLWVTGATGVSSMRAGIFHDDTPVDNDGVPGSTDCLLDPQRRFWLRCHGTFYEGAQGKLLPMYRSPSTSSTWTVDSSGALWLTDRNGLDRLDATGTTHIQIGPVTTVPIRNSTFHTPHSTFSDSVSGLAAGVDGRVWAASTHGIYSIQNRRVDNVLTGAGMNAVAVDGHGTVWALISGRLLQLDGDRFQPVKDWAGIRVDQISVNPGGDLVCRFGGDSGNVAIAVNRTFVYVGTRDGLSGRPLCCYRDDQGDVWVGTDNGLDSLRDRACQTLSVASGLGASRITSALVDFGWHVLVAEDNGNVYRYSGDSDQRFSLLMHSAGPLRSLVETPDGVYLCIVDGVVMQLIDKSLKPYAAADALRRDLGDASALGVSADGDLWIAGTRKTALLSHGTVHEYDLPVASSSIATYVDHQNRFWIATESGLGCIDGDQVRILDKSVGLKNAAIEAICEDSTNHLWFGTRGAGLLRYADGKFQSVTRRDGLPSNIVSQIFEDDARNLWFGCPNEIFRVGVGELNSFVTRRAPFHAYHYGPADGVTGGSCLSGTQLSGLHGWVSCIWFPCQFGMVRVEPWENSSGACPVDINQALLNGKRYDPSTAAAATPGDGDVTIRFTALDLKDPEHLQFSYCLDGFDAGWIEAGRFRQAIYTNLPPGTYRFNLKCVNVDGGWTATRSFTFTLRPHFYQTWQFRLFALLALLGLIYAIVRMRINGLHERNRVLEELHEQLAYRNERLRESHEELEVQNLTLADLQSELEAQNEELMENKSILESANIKLKSLATTDGLTGLTNHRTFQEELVLAWNEAQKTGRPLSLLMIDVDKFKEFNDHFGHQAGDRVLVAVGEILAKTARDGDLVARYGGEEFAVILRRTAAAPAIVAAERFREAVQRHASNEFAVTVSVGVSTMSKAMAGANDLVKAADVALYASKHHGRNCVTHTADVKRDIRPGAVTDRAA